MYSFKPAPKPPAAEKKNGSGSRAAP